MEGLNEEFQRRIVEVVPRGSRIDVAPVLHPVYLPHLMRQSPILRDAGLTLEAYDDKQPGDRGMWCIFTGGRIRGSRWIGRGRGRGCWRR